MKWRDAKSLRKQAQALGPWFHNLHLPGGVQTAPDHHFGDFPAFKWRSIAPHLPADLAGWRALDIGCNAGFYSLALAGRGAEVTGLEPDPHYRRQAEWAAEVAGVTSIRFLDASVYDIGSLPGRCDLVLFMGVFYHLRHPLLALDLLGALAPRLMVFQTLTCGDDRVSPAAGHDLTFQQRHLVNDPAWPRMAFVEASFAGDPTNWWIPNHAAVAAMLRSAGFRIRSRPGHEIYLCEPDPSPSGGDRASALAAARRIAAAEGGS